MAKSNLIQRVLAAAVFGPVLVVLFWLGDYWLFIMWCGVVSIGTWEFYRMLSQKGLQPWTGFGIVISLS
ncbi:MAG: phosphatidate cytidylyltransferase, partial [Gemmatimonadota bacterium]|nr:phosphatidate cytidylyltransferase [Gemmatimonadota bacterium]